MSDYSLRFLVLFIESDFLFDRYKFSGIMKGKEKKTNKEEKFIMGPPEFDDRDKPLEKA